MSALTMLGLAVVGAVLYTLFQKSAPAFGLFVSMGVAVLVLWKISTAAEIVLAGLERLEQRAGGDAFSCLLRCTGVILVHGTGRPGAGAGGGVAPAGRDRSEDREHCGMKWDKFFRFGLAILFLWTSLALAAPAARAASDTTLPGSALWEPYLQQSRIGLEGTVSSPWETLKSFLPQSLGAMVQQTARDYTSVLLFLTLTAVLGLLAGECADSDLLDLAAAGGCGVLLWGNLVEEAQTLCAQMESWRSFLLGFLPVYAGVLTMGGEAAAGSAASGTLLTALCFLAQLAAAFVQPLLHCYLMLSMACCISAEPALGVFCKGVGSALRQALGWAGKVLVALLGLQRAAAFQLDRFSLRTGQLLAGSVPIIGQTLSSASESILAGVQMLKSGLGLAALSVLGAEFVPLYLGLMIQLALLMGGSLLCSLTGISRCRALFDCFAEAVRCMAAAVALFFGLAAAGVALLFMVGGGS